MSKNIVKKTERPLSDKPNMDRSRNPYPPERPEIEEPQARFKQSAAGTDAQKAPARAVRVEFSSTPSRVTTNSSRPNSVPSTTETNRSPAPAQQKLTNIVPAPKPPAVLTTPPAKTVQSTPPTRTEKPVVVVQAQKPAAPSTTNVKFALGRPDAKQIWLCGDFNGWSCTNIPMKRRNDGEWETTIALMPGRYQYKFLVDGEWITDPTASQNVANPFGSFNSVLEVLA